MGFTKAAVPKTIAIPMVFEIEQRDSDGGETIYSRADVVHYFNRPTPGDRERLADSMTNPRGRGRSAKRVLEATFAFWSRTIDRVKGYDDLETFCKDHGDFKLYFRDDIGMEHVQASVILLLDTIGAEEGDLLKKSVWSQENSSDQDQTSPKTLISEMG